MSSSSSKDDIKRRAALQALDLERANEKLKDRVDTATSSNAPLNPDNEDMNQIPPMAMAKAAGLAFTLMGAAFLNVRWPAHLLARAAKKTEKTRES